MATCGTSWLFEMVVLRANEGKYECFDTPYTAMVRMGDDDHFGVGCHVPFLGSGATYLHIRSG